jgi:hypothetical protein
MATPGRVWQRLEKLTNHAALGGPELTSLKARVARQRGVQS